MFFTINLYSIIMLRCPWKNCPSIKCSEIRFSTHWIAFSIIWMQVNGSRKITIMLSMLISTNRYAGTREKFWWLSSLREKLNTRSGYFSTIISEIPAVCSQVKNHCNFSGVYWRLQLSHGRSDQGEGQGGCRGRQRRTQAHRDGRNAVREASLKLGAILRQVCAY